MDIQSAVLNQLFVLFPVIIQGWFTPVRPAGIAHGGIPQVLYDGQLQGLECLIDPWPELQLQSWTMAVDDRVDLYINDNTTPVTGVTVKPGEEALRQRLYIPHGYLRQGVNRLHYKVTRAGGNTSEDSRDLLVLYHLRTPDNLDLVIPADVINEGVSAERAAQGVEFRFFYNNRRPYDRIELLIGDTLVTFDVADGNGPITHTLFTDAFLAAGNNPSAVIQFFVFDQLGNRSESPQKRLDIHLEAETFDSPILRERLNDPGDDQAIDLEKLAGNPLLIIVPTGDSRFQVGDLISVTYICKVTGQPDVVVTPPAGTVEADEFGQRKPCVIEVPNKHVIPDGAVTATYKVHRANGDAVGSSRVARAQVIGEALPAATLVFTNGPYEVLAGKAFDVRLLLTRDGVPQMDAVVTLRLASGFQFPGRGVGGERDFITDAKGVVTVTGIIASGTEGSHKLVARSDGFLDATSLVKVSAQGGIGFIDVGDLHQNIVVANDGLIYVECEKTIVAIDSQTDRVIDSFDKGYNRFFIEMVIAPDGTKIYGCADTLGVFVIDLTLRKFIKQLPFPGYNLASSKVANYIACNSSRKPASIRLIDPTTDTVRHVFSAPLESTFILFSADGSRIYSNLFNATPWNNYLTSINSTTGAVINTNTTSRIHKKLYLSSDGTQIYTILSKLTSADTYSNYLLEFSADSLQLLRRTQIKGSTPNSSYKQIVAVLPDHIIITDRYTTKAVSFDLRSGAESESIDIGHTGTWNAVCTLDYKRLYACNPNGRHLSVVTIDT
ncbi:YncE family protein [Pseudomonas baetica]|uniref:YncE family protein n=1 Tax=Pseudomonas baetica TaxID=674054 RepID=UPI002871D4BD|nr:hypothetical protein [Pseudomonas baetica]MDR9864177.1 hypothetical protein [Pseudomonas baetica]